MPAHLGLRYRLWPRAPRAGLGHWAVLVLHHSLTWASIFSAPMRSRGRQRCRTGSRIPCTGACACEGAEPRWYMCASLKGSGTEVESTKLLLLSYFIQTICIASGFFFFPHEISSHCRGLGAGECPGFAGGLLPCSGRGSSTQHCGSQAALPASSACQVFPTHTLWEKAT